MQTKIETAQGNTGDLKHPDRETWMSWVYGELPRGQHTALAAHLKDCATCRANVESWRGAMRMLDQWQIAPRPSHARAARPALKWAVAACLTLAIGFGAGRFFTASAQTAALRASVRQEILGEVQRQLADFKQNADEQHEADNKVIFTAIAKSDAARLADYAAMHKDLETVAVLTQEGFQRAQHQLYTLANYNQSDVNSPGR
jgi:hypothetical protein